MRITMNRRPLPDTGIAELAGPRIDSGRMPRFASGVAAITAGRKPAVAGNTLQACLGFGCVAACFLALGLPAESAADLDPDFVRLMRFMAVMKGAFLAVALVGSAWRLSRPATAWRTAVYVGAPTAMAFGTVALWRLAAAGPAAAALHLGMVALLAAALTDKDFIPTRTRR